MDNAIVMSWAVVTADTLYAAIGTFGHVPGALLALDTATGEERWRQSGTRIPTLVDETLYVGGERVRALDAADGSEQWSFAPEGEQATTTAVVDGRVFTTSDWTVYALDAGDGSVVWEDDRGGGVGRDAPVAVADGTVYAARTSPQVRDGSKEVVALDAADGTEQWRVELNGVVTAPAVEDGRVYVVTNDGTVHAFDAGDGTRQWQTEPAGRTKTTPSSPSVAHDRVYLRTEEEAYALDAADGRVDWQVSAGKGFPYPLPVVEDSVAVPGPGTLAVHDATDGTEQYAFDLADDESLSGTTVLDGTAYFGITGAGTFEIHALGNDG